MKIPNEILNSLKNEEMNCPKKEDKILLNEERSFIY